MTGVVIGVDEAGRGSLVGELIVVAFAMREDSLGVLEDLGVRDSKELSRERRASLYRALARLGIFAVAAISPADIDAYNINELEAAKAAEVVARLSKLVNASRGVVIVDKFGDVSRLKKLVEREVGGGFTVVVEEKADARYPIVAAASIIAKHLRDTRISVLSKIYGVEGSGYPSDERTIEWVKRVLERGEKPPIIRYSWYTVKKLGGPWVKKTGKVKSRSLDEFIGL